MIKRVYALSHIAMEDMVGANALKHETVMPSPEHGYISILNPEWPRVFETDADHVITLFFDDISRAYPDTPVDGRILTLFGDEQARKIVDFVDAFSKRPTSDTLYVHCRQGISRSGAVATFVNEVCKLDTAQFAADNPELTPNQHVLQLLHYHWRERERLRKKQSHSEA